MRSYIYIYIYTHLFYLALCPPGVDEVKCFINPCDTAKCEGYPNAECRSNYCGGCNSDFYVNNKKVQCCKSRQLIHIL